MANKYKRCSKCCTFFADHEWHNCRYLKKFKDGSSYCSIFPNRIGRTIFKAKNGTILKCMWREDVPYNWEGCPYNKPEWSEVNEASYIIDPNQKLVPQKISTAKNNDEK